MVSTIEAKPGMIARRGLLALAGGTLAAGLVARKPRAAESFPGPEALKKLSQPVAHPTLGFSLPDGTRRSFADYAGRALVVNFWATWCAPCVAEMPALAALAQAGAAEGILVLPVSLDRGGAPAVAKFYQNHRLVDLPVLLDPKSAAMQVLGLSGVPQTLIIGRDGTERARSAGPVAWDRPDVLAAIRALVG